MDRVPVTSTRHELNFTALSPYDFERLCLWLVERRYSNGQAEHIGAAGGDHGRDIVARRQVGGRTELLYVQCKRIRSRPGRQMFAAEIAKVSDAVRRSLIAKPDTVLFIVTQYLSGDLRSVVSKLCQDAGYQAEFLGLSELDRDVKADKKILAEFFDLSPGISHTKRRQGLPFERVTPHHLRPARLGFVNRAAELELLKRAVTGTTQSSTILVLEGPNGVGKSRLAEEWAQRRKDGYPDGQILIDFRALRASPAGSVAEALRSILLAFGCPPKKIPDTLPDRVGLYRTLTAQRRLMLVLDHVTEAGEVHALVPDADRALLLVTTNSDLAALRLYGAISVPVDILDAAHARSMLQALVGHPPMSEPESRACDTVLAYCAGLPLAIELCATRIRDAGLGSYGWLAVELEQEETRLQRMGAASESLDVVFGTAYLALPDDLARAYRLLGQAPRLSSVSQAAAVLGVGEHATTSILSALRIRHLLEVNPVQASGAPGRTDIGMHDLLRLHARTVALAHGPESTELVHRLAQYAAARARQIDRAISPDRLRVELSWQADGYSGTLLADDGSEHSTPAELTHLNGAEATRIFEGERGFIMAVQSQAFLAGLDAAVCIIADSLWPAMYDRGYNREIASVFTPAVTAAERLGDLRALCRLRMLLARGLTLIDDHTSALAQCEMAIQLAHEQADDWLLAAALEVKGLLVLELSGPAEALGIFQESRSRFPADRERGRAIQDLHIGMCLARLERHAEAIAAFSRAEATLERLRDAVLLARTGWRLAESLLAVGDRDEAAKVAVNAEERATSAGEYSAQGRALLILAELSSERDMRRRRLQAALDAFVAAADETLAAVAATRLREVESAGEDAQAERANEDRSSG